MHCNMILYETFFISFKNILIVFLDNYCHSTYATSGLQGRLPLGRYPGRI